MSKLLNHIRTPKKKISLMKALFYTVLITGIGLILGIIVKLLDIYTTNLGNIFSQMSVWIFLCTLLAVYSSTPKRAAINVLCFCIGMLVAYYLTAELTGSAYSMLFFYGWSVFALFSPIMGFGVWYAKGKGLISKIIIVSIIVIMLLTAILLFDKIRIADIVFSVLTGAILLRKENTA
uniref:DUF6518 family protein n=1 Tax=Agathobacter sp. TaxID=2021311 RepID=UPI004055DE2F